MKKISTISLSLLALATSLSASATLSDSKETSFTIYNGGFGMVNEVRDINIPKGISTVRQDKVPSNIMVDSLITKFNSPGAAPKVLSTSYKYDTVNYLSIAKYKLGQEVSFYSSEMKNGDSVSVIRKGQLVAVSPAMVKTERGLESVANFNIIFNEIPKEISVHPSLSWNIYSPRAIHDTVNISYLAKGVSWSSNYVFYVDNLSKASFKGWITLKNNSGMSFLNTNLYFIAGEVKNVSKPSPRRTVLYKNAIMAETAYDKGVSEESFGGYHLYKIPGKVTVENKENKMFSFIDINLKAISIGKTTVPYLWSNSKTKLSFSNTILVKDGADKPIPAGTVRVYSKDSKGEVHFMGSDNIPHKAKNTKIELSIGQMFDVTGTEKTLKFYRSQNSDHLTSTKEFKLKNSSSEKVLVQIERPINSFNRLDINNLSCTETKAYPTKPDSCTFEREGSYLEIIKVMLAPESKKTIVVKYSASN